MKVAVLRAESRGFRSRIKEVGKMGGIIGTSHGVRLTETRLTEAHGGFERTGSPVLSKSPPVRRSFQSPTIATSHGDFERTGEKAEEEDVWSNVWSHIWPFQIHQLCIVSNDDDEATHTRLKTKALFSRFPAERFTAFPAIIHRSSSDPIPAESRPVRAIKDIQPGKHSIYSIQPTQSSVFSPSASPASVSSPSARPAALTVGKPAQNEAKMRRSSRNLRTMSVEAWKCHGTPPGTALARLVEKKIGGLQENTKRYTPPKTPSVCVFVCVSALSCLSPPLYPSTQDTHPLSPSFAFSLSL